MSDQKLYQISIKGYKKGKKNNYTTFYAVPSVNVSKKKNKYFPQEFEKRNKYISYFYGNWVFNIKKVYMSLKYCYIANLLKVFQKINEKRKNQIFRIWNLCQDFFFQPQMRLCGGTKAHVRI